MSIRIEDLKLPELQKYLRERGITVNGRNKPQLIEIALAADRLQLPTDPDFSSDVNIINTVKFNLQKANLSAYIKCDPLLIDNFTVDFSNIPAFGLIDIFNYLICSKADYDGNKLKSYKSFEDYRLFYDGHVESLMFNYVHPQSTCCIFKSKVKPTQRDKTYLSKDCYELWFAVNKSDGSVVTGYCECKGGADGACRHLSAALYELEAFEKKSCTDGDNKWKRRSRNSDVSTEIRHMDFVVAKYVNNSQSNTKSTPKPFGDVYDPRALTDRSVISDEQKRGFGLKLKEISANTQVLDILLLPDDIQMKEPVVYSSTISKSSIFYTALKFSNDHVIN